MSMPMSPGLETVEPPAAGRGRCLQPRVAQVHLKLMLKLPLRTADWSLKIGKLAAKTVPKPGAKPETNETLPRPARRPAPWPRYTISNI
jgi:hypothetical protein